MNHQAKATTEGAAGGAVVGAAVGGPVGAAVGAGVGGVVAHNNSDKVPTPNLPTASNNSTPSSSYSNGASTYSAPSNAATRNEPSHASAATGTANNTNANPQTNIANDNMNNNGMNNAGNETQDHQLVRDAQRALNDKGYPAGAADGIMGPHTEKALRDFQQAQGLTASGDLDQQTLSALGVQQ
jgi:murein L,D-transpeptidase YcbB/YkuD